MIRSLDALLDRIGRWRADRYPHVSSAEIALKLVEEVGELCSAVLGEVSPSEWGKGSTEEEAADVFITLVALARKRGIDLGAAVERKLRMLETAGAHRGSVTARGMKERTDGD